MNEIEKGIIYLVKSAITGEKLPLPAEFDLEQAYPVILRHSIIPICYFGARQCGIPKETLMMQKLIVRYYKIFDSDRKQMQAVEQLFQSFDAHKIDYMPVKGCLMKRLYPNPELRAMGDADILIRTEQYDQIRPLMEGLGFQEAYQSDHELAWRSEFLLVELHKRLIPSYNKDYYRYFGDGWKLASAKQGTRYSMTDEDQFIYLFTHFSKHYRDGGIGMRHVTDLWVFLRSKPELDVSYVEKELKKLNLLVFYQNMRAVISAWFEDGPWTEKVNFISDFIFSSGNWGLAQNHLLSEGVKKASEEKSVKSMKRHDLLHHIFPSASDLNNRYPVLKKAPVLLPLIWIWRPFDVLLHRRENIGAFANRMEQFNDQNISDYQATLDYVGLQFQFQDPDSKQKK